VNLETIGKITSQLGEVKGHINRMASRIGEVFGVEHDNETGAHTTITATGSVTAGGGGTFAGPVTATGDLKALTGTAAESGLGILTTVNGAAFQSGEVTRWGLLVGGPTNGYWIELRSATSPYTTGYEIAIWLFSFSTTIPIWRLGSIAGVPTWLNGSGGANVGLGLNSSGDRFAQIAVNDLWAHNGLTEHDRAAKLGEWTAVSYAAGNFTASAGAWTVDSGDQNIYRYALVGKTMFLRWSIASTDVTVGGVLRLAIPGGFTANVGMDGFHRAIDAGGAAVAAMCRVTAGAAFVELYATANAGNFGVTAADDTTVVGGLDFEVA
jgi:hypothetical protein